VTGDPQDHGVEQPPLDYPSGALPPPVYPPPAYPPAYYPGYPGAYYPAAPYDPYRPRKPLGTNGKAIAALVCSAAGILCCGVSSIAGLILGVIAMRETRRTGQDGYGIALAGTVIGALAVVGLALYLLLSIGLWASSWQWV
jgi:hypothetical protein